MEKLINDFKISFTKGDTYAIAVKFKNISEDLRTAFFTVKENPDDEPLIQKCLGAGIDKIDDREYKNEKTYKVQIQAGDTVNLEANVQYLYDLQVSIDNVVKTVLSGVFVVHHSITGITTMTTATLEVAVDDEVETEVLTVPATNGVEYETDPVATAKIGDLTALGTTNKETIVKAINEVKNGVLSTEENVNKILNGTTKTPSATTADYAISAGKATQDGNGNIIHETYPQKTQIQLYQHRVYVYVRHDDKAYGETTRALILIYNNSSNKFTEAELVSYLGKFDLAGYPVGGHTAVKQYSVDQTAFNVVEYPLLRVFVGNVLYGDGNILHFSYTDCTTEVNYNGNTQAYTLGNQYRSTKDAHITQITDTVTPIFSI